MGGGGPLPGRLLIDPQAEKQAVGGVPQCGNVQDQVGRDRNSPNATKSGNTFFFEL